MFRQKPICYLLVGRHGIWIVYQDHVVHVETSSESLTPDTIVEKCSKWRCSKIILYLEFPWVLTAFQAIIPLSRTDTTQYSRNILGFHHTNPEKFSKIGASFLDLPEKNKKGLFCASLPPQTLQLIEALQRKHRVKVEPIPLLYACLEELLRQPANSILFYGINQVIFIEKQNNVLQKITLLPESMAKEANEKVIEDYLNISPDTIHPLSLSEHAQPTINNTTHLSILSVIRQGKGIAKNASHAFWWETREISWKTNWKWVGVQGWMGIMLFLIGWNFIAIEANQKLQQQLTQSDQKVKEDQTKMIQFKEYTAQQEHFIQVNTIYQHLKASSAMAKQMLDQLITPMNAPVWIEKLIYEEHRLELHLLAMEKAIIPEVLDQLEAVLMVNKILLQSQQMIQLEQRDIVKFALQIELRTEHAKTPQTTSIAGFVE